VHISIFGLGYVGCVNLACLAKNGFHIIGVDVKPEKVAAIQQGRATVVEKDLDALILSHRSLVTSMVDSLHAVHHSDVSFICVGTPPAPNGDLDLSNVWTVAGEIGQALRTKNPFHLIALRSTIPPGTCAKVIAMVEQISGKTEGQDFEVIYNPEFIREGNAIDDYLHPGLIVLGSSRQKSKGLDTMLEIYKNIQAPIRITNMGTSEIIKFINNSWHALKIAFANECSSIGREMGIDAHEMMDLFCADHKLNLSSAYLKPGFAYGGYCLPKDLQGLVAMGKNALLNIPLLSSIAESNTNHLENIGKWICSFHRKQVLLLGISFKEGTDDVRMSPKIDLARYLLASGCNLFIYDQNMNRSTDSQLLGEITRYLIDDVAEILDGIDLVILANNEKEYVEIAHRAPAQCIILDLQTNLTDTHVEKNRSLSSQFSYSRRSPAEAASHLPGFA
jgi:GDP-mannose 6-dehydrogenase